MQALDAKLLRAEPAPLPAVLAAGCVQRCPTTVAPIDEVVGGYNANANKVPRLWARARIAVSIVDAAGRRIDWGSTSPLASPNGKLLLGKNPGPAASPDLLLQAYEGTITNDVYFGTNPATAAAEKTCKPEVCKLVVDSVLPK